jgi:hypothetical protein
MANLDLYLEAERRGILPPDKAALLNEARSRGLVPGAPGMPQDQMPEPRMTTGQQVLQFARPTIEALGTAGGAALGAPLGPAGIVGGAGLGYGMTQEGLRLVRRSSLVIVSLARARRLLLNLCATYLKVLRLRPVVVQLLALF